MPPPGEYPHHMPGSVTAEQVSAHLAENPTMYHTGLDSHMEANGITVDRSAELSPVDALEAEAATTAEANTAHNWGELADMSRTEVHVQEHEAVGRKLDPWYGERTSEEQTAISVIGELGEEAEAAVGVTLEGGENVAETSLGQELAQLPERLQPRIAEALEASDFAPTPEVKEAITGYYTDHYKLAAVIDKVLDGAVTPEDATKIGQEQQAETFAIDQDIRSLVAKANDPSSREKVLRDVDRLLNGVLFHEWAVGLQTVGSQEIGVAVRLHEKMQARAVAEGFASPPDSNYSGMWLGPPRYTMNRSSDVESGIKFSTGNFWKDTRHAGQLLFHNSGNFAEIARSGYRLMSRTKQLEESGTFHVQTAVAQNGEGNMHSNVPHWSEGYDPLGYKSGDRHKTPGTLAMPLAEIIKTAPYARNAEYGTVQLKPNRAVGAEQVPAHDDIIDIGPGAPDGPSEYGVDRVFFADYRADHAAQAVRYAFDASVGSASESGNKSLQLFTSGEERVFYDGSDTYGIGEYFPGKVILDFDYAGAFDPKSQNQPNTSEAIAERMRQREDMRGRLGEQIHKLQRESRERPEYVGRYVVPLRRGVMEFQNEGNYSPNDPLARHQKQVLHSAVSADVARAVKERTGRW